MTSKLKHIKLTPLLYLPLGWSDVKIIERNKLNGTLYSPHPPLQNVRSEEQKKKTLATFPGSPQVIRREIGKQYVHQ